MGLRPLELASAQPTPAELESPPRLHAHGPFGRTPERCHRHEASGPGASPTLGGGFEPAAPNGTIPSGVIKCGNPQLNGGF